MKPFIVLLTGDETFATYASNSKDASAKVCRAVGWPGNTNEAISKPADSEALELFDDEFEESRETGKPVRIVTE